MKNPQLAVVFSSAGIGCLALAIFGESVRSVFLAVGVLCLLLSYVANQRSRNRLKVDPFTSQQVEAFDNKLDKKDV